MIIYDPDDYRYFDRKTKEKIRIEEAKERVKERKKINKSYLKGQYGVRRYYDYDKQKEISDDILEIEDEEEYQKALIYNRPIKCVFKKDLRREKLYMYLKYLNGRKVLIRDLAWKFAGKKQNIKNCQSKYVNYYFVVKLIYKLMIYIAPKNISVYFMGILTLTIQ